MPKVLDMEISDLQTMYKLTRKLKIKKLLAE